MLSNLCSSPVAQLGERRWDRDRGYECAGETPQPLPKRGGEEQLSDLRPLPGPCGHLINASCENIYPGGNGSCFPFLPGGWGEGLHWSRKFQQHSCSAPRLPGCPGEVRQRCQTQERAVTGARYTAGRPSLQEHIYVHLSLLFSSFSSISFKLSCHLSLFYPGSPEGTLTCSPAWQVMQWVGLANGHSRSEILRAEVSTGLEKPFVSLNSGCPGSLSVVLLSSLERHLDVLKRMTSGARAARGSWCQLFHCMSDPITSLSPDSLPCEVKTMV